MQNKLAIVLCAHHKPWLLMSTLVSLALQDFKDFDVFFVYQKGDGEPAGKKSYEEYYALKKEYGANRNLSTDDPRVKDVIDAFQWPNVEYLEFENDHTLDSGAWYKFIQTKKWERYANVFFVQEGTVFTRDSVLSAVVDFSEKNNVHFLSAGHEKRKLSKNLFLHYYGRQAHASKYNLFLDAQIQNAFRIYCRDPRFAEVYAQWSNEFTSSTESHVPNFDSFHTRMKQGWRTFRTFGEHIWIGKSIYVDTVRRKLENIVPDYAANRRVLFHKVPEIEWFGCSCQHFLSNELLSKFSQALEQYNLYDVLDLPFAGTPLEVLWGFLPAWFGYEKWFFDGIHRVRKNFVTYKREDDPSGMSSYINRYFGGKIHVVPDEQYVRIEKNDRCYRGLRDILGTLFFV